MNDDLYGYEVTDESGEKVGTVENMWRDKETNKLEFVSVKSGWLPGKAHILPTAGAHIDAGASALRVAYPKSLITDAPSVAEGEDISPEEEDGIYDYYGLDRSTSRSRTGLPSGESSRTDTGDKSMTLSEEQLRVGKREVETGRVRLRKVVREERVEQPVELRHEEVQIERVDANGRDVPADAFQEREVEVVARHEEPVVAKEARVTGQVRVGKDVRTESTTVGENVRTEDVEVDPETDLNVRRS